MESSNGKKCIIDTPTLSHATGCDWQYVYEPAEDTFLLLDALEKDIDFLLSRKPSICLEVGSGSGVIVTALSKLLRTLAHCVAVDVNIHACQLTQKTAVNNNAYVDVIEGDLTSCFKRSCIDLVVFNPPYVVTPSDELKTGDHLTKSWAGGENGREVIDRFIGSVREVLDIDGFGYILLLKENHPEDVIDLLKSKSFEADVVASRKLRGEELYVVKFLKRR